MKTLLAYCFFFFIALTGFSQRVIINGTVKVPPGEDPQGISIVNTTAMRASVSNAAGLFQIRASEGDTLNFTSLQFQDFSVIIDKGVIETRELNVFVSEAVTELPEVVVTPYDLSGNVRVDVKIIPTSDLAMPTMSAAEIDPYEWDFPPDSLVSPPNVVMRNGKLYNGANFANIFRNILEEEEKNNLEESEQIEEQILRLYDDEFFKVNLDIKKENIKEFIYYAQDHGLTKAMLEPKNEMKLIQFLVVQSQRFKEFKAANK